MTILLAIVLAAAFWVAIAFMLAGAFILGLALLAIVFALAGLIFDRDPERDDARRRNGR